MNEISERPHRPEHGHLRRFALAMGVILLAIALAGISLEPVSKFDLLGIPFRLTRPQLLPYVVLLASLYGLLRFYYYGVLVTKSPYAARRELMNRLISHVHMASGFSYVQARSFGMYYGPVDFELGPKRPWMSKRDREGGEGEPAQEQPSAWAVTNDSHGNPIMPDEGIRFQIELEKHFPAIGGERVGSRWNYESREPPMKVRLMVWIPNRCRLATLLEDIDYTAPIWFNLIAIAAFVWSRIVG